MTQEASRYRFGPLERRGVLVGLRGPQLVLLCVAGVLCVMLLRLLPPSVGLGASVLTALTALVATFVPLKGRTIDEWVPLGLRWAADGWRGRLSFRSGAPNDGSTDARLHLPPALDGLEILAHPVPGAVAPIGVAKDPREGTYTGVLSVSGTSFALLNRDEKERRLGAWAAILAGAARESGLIHRLQWVERTIPDTSDRVAQHLKDNIAVPADSPLARSYLELVDEAGPATQDHEVLLALQIDAVSAARAIKAAGGGDVGACEIVRRELASLSSSLRGTDLVVAGALTPRLVAQSLRTAFDPASRRALSTMATNGRGEEGTSPDNAGPMASETYWTRFRSDGAWHATYWVAEWPRIGTDADFLMPLLLRTGCTRTVSLTMQPLSPSRAIRSVESARTSAAADEELRHRAGFVSTMRRQRENEALVDNERELADGHAFYRFSGFVTVTAEGPEELDAACSEVEEAAARSLLDLRLLCGQQEAAFGYTLPLCRGLR